MQTFTRRQAQELKRDDFDPYADPCLRKYEEYVSRERGHCPKWDNLSPEAQALSKRLSIHESAWKVARKP